MKIDRAVIMPEHFSIFIHGTDRFSLFFMKKEIPRFVKYAKLNGLQLVGRFEKSEYAHAGDMCVYGINSYEALTTEQLQHLGIPHANRSNSKR